MKEDKSKNILIAVLIIIIIALVGVVFVAVNKDINIFSNATNEKKNENNNKDGKEDKTDTPKTYKFEKVAMDSCDFKEGCIINHNGTQIEGRMANLETQEYYQIAINGVKTYESTEPIKEIYAIDDLFVALATLGTDVTDPELGIFESKVGEIIKVISWGGNDDKKLELLDSKHKSMHLDLETPIKMSGNKLIVKGSRLFHGPSIIMNDNLLDSLKSPCDLEDNEEIGGTYEIEYLGNREFRINNIGYDYLKDYENRNACNTVK